VPEDKEESEGGYIPINANNDNGSPFKMVDGKSTGFPEKRDFDPSEKNLAKEDKEFVHLKPELPQGMDSADSGNMIVTQTNFTQTNAEPKINYPVHNLGSSLF